MLRRGRAFCPPVRRTREGKECKPRRQGQKGEARPNQSELGGRDFQTAGRNQKGGGDTPKKRSSSKGKRHGLRVLDLKLHTYARARQEKVKSLQGGKLYQGEGSLSKATPRLQHGPSDAREGWKDVGGRGRNEGSHKRWGPSPEATKKGLEKYREKGRK